MSAASIKLMPEDKIRCLMVQPLFSSFSFWNYVASCELFDAKTPSPPLGLLTVAALLPQHWEFRLLDLNTRPFSNEDWAWADMICVGGMLPQQEGILAVIDRAIKDGKFCAVGGSDPSSQPDIYKHASALVVGEGESAIPIWLDSWRAGQPTGVFHEKEKPDVSLSPVPRYDLLDFANYGQIGVQYSRGCPFNCEFCDIIELFGRKPRTKTPEQITRELDRIKELGYSGPVDMVDDNFIGNKRNVKRQLLPALIAWNKKNGYPFFYATECSMNMADDVALMEQMREAEFRFIFVGVETPDPDILLMTQKSQNTVKPIVDRIHAIYRHGMVVMGGFIMGFDGEKKGMDKAMIKMIEECAVNMAMVGLLVALPNTQLTRRLLKEKRLFNFQGEPISNMEQMRSGARSSGAIVKVVDQTVAGLNFTPTRDRIEILEEFMVVIKAIYEPKAYFARALRVGQMLQSKSKHRPRWFEIRRNAIGFVRTARALRRDPETRWLFYGNMLKLMFKGPVVLEQVIRLMGIYIHFKRQAAYILETMEKNMPTQRKIAARQVATVEAVAVEDPKKGVDAQGTHTG